MPSQETTTRLDFIGQMKAERRGLSDWKVLLRATLAATISFAIASAISPSETALLAPMTAILVVQSSAFATVGETVQRIGGSAVGVAVAGLYVTFFDPSSGLGKGLVYAVGVLLSLALPRLMPVTDSARMQVTLSMLFVLTLGPGAWESDVGRIIDTILGGVIAMGTVLLFPSKPDLLPTREAFARWYQAVAEQLREMSRGIGHGTVPAGERHEFVAGSFALRDLDLESRRTFGEAVESMAFNPRARAETAEQLDTLERDLRWITSITVQVRALSGEIDRLYDREGGDPPALNPYMLSAILVGLAKLLRAEMDPKVARTTIDRRNRNVQGFIAEATDLVTNGRADVKEVLQSLALLGRLDSLGRTISGGPGRLSALPWDETAVAGASQPVGPPTGLMEAIAPEDDPTMTIALPLLNPPKRT